jgi:signal peptidase II
MQRTRRTPLSDAQPTGPTEPVDEDSSTGSGTPEGEPAEDTAPESGAAPDHRAEHEPEPGTGPHDGSAVPPARRRTSVLFAAVAVAALVADQVTKTIALRSLEPGEPVDLIGSLLRFHLVKNPGAAFSLGTGYTVVLTCIAVGVAAAVVHLSRRLRSTAWTIALGLLLGGALGNLSDRFFREPAPLRGHVIDFLELPSWPIFNLADTAIVTAACLMVLQTLRGVGLDGTREHRVARSDPG